MPVTLLYSNTSPVVLVNVDGVAPGRTEQPRHAAVVLALGILAISVPMARYFGRFPRWAVSGKS